MIITKTPLRVSFFGGGTDLPAFYEKDEGAVLSVAINKYIYIALHRYFEPRFALKYSKTEVVDQVDQIQHRLIRECFRMTGTQPGIELSSFADITANGSGLGSSSSFAVGLIKALYAFQGRHISAESCADLACQVEIEQLDEPIGKQDQYACACGGLNQIRFLQDGRVLVDPVVLNRAIREELEQRLLLVYTGHTRSASATLAEQSNRTRTRPETREVLRLMREQTFQGRELLTSRDLDGFGELLREAWELKKRLSPSITDPGIEGLYDRGLSAGALGGKLVGAGGGGFILFYCHPRHQPRLRAVLSQVEIKNIRFDAQGSRVALLGDD